MKKRGQVTLFVIIGFVVLIVAGLLIYLVSNSVVEEVPTEDILDQNLDARIAPLVNDISFCIESLAKEKLVELGSTGGFVIENPEIYRTDLIPEYANNALELFPESDVIYPFWYEMTSGPDCVSCDFAIHRPFLKGDAQNTIESIVEDYVDENILDCMDNFDTYKDIFDVEYEVPESAISFNADDTTIFLDWPMTVDVLSEDSVTIDLDAFVGKLDLRMSGIYDLATNILYEVIIGKQALDDLAIQVSDYGGFGADSPLPPRGDASLGFDAPRYWRTSEVKEIIRERIASNIPLVQILGSREHYVVFAPEDDFKRNIYYRHLHSVSDDERQLGKTRIRFSFMPEWPLYVKVNPSQGELIMPEINSLSLPFFSFAMTKYDFDYDISYPSLITLEDEDAFNGEGYIFQFSVENNVRSSISYAEKLNVSRPESVVNGGGYFSPDNAIVPVVIRVVDAATLLPVDEIGVMYTCVDEVGIVGTTELKNGHALIETTLPPCVDGRFSGIGADNYSLEELKISIIEGGENRFLLHAFKDKKIQVFPKKKLYSLRVELEEEIDNYYWDFNPSGTVSKDVNEELVVILTKVENDNPTGFVQVANIKGNANSGIMYLRPGTYNLMIVSNLILEQDIVTDPEELCADGECSTIESETLTDSIIYGYVQFDSSTSGPIEITVSDLENNYLNVFYAGFDKNDIQYTRQFSVMGKIIDASTENRNALLPKFE